jgi:predicted nucleic acid-binding protein
LTDDGDARMFAKNQGVTVIGSVGVLLTALDAGRIDKSTANDYLQTWIDDYSYYVPYRSIDYYR